MSDTTAENNAPTGERLRDARVNMSVNVGPSAEAEANAVFGQLVAGDSDIVGLVAYSIYKQNKQDWLIAFAKALNRKPNDPEINAYVIGESTPRRIATYRHLAEATLEGRGPTTPAGTGGEGFAQRNYAAAARHIPRSSSSAPTQNRGLIGVMGLAVIVAIGLFLAMRYGFPKPGEIR
jgi:hypothetical protein